MRILICDDSITIRKKLAKSLRSFDTFEIIEAVNGVEAIELYKKHLPDLVFMDIVMPEKNGLEAVEEIVKENKEAQIVILSSVGTKENLKEALKIGAIDFIQKPWDHEMLERIVSRNSVG